jgi:DNA-binding transcriptional regulator GbsR (MarR family)
VDERKSSMSIEQQKLLEDLVSQLQVAHQLNPLGAQMLAYFIMDTRDEGCCFDELVGIFQASKSSVSTNLQLLLQMNFIEAFSKMGCRKRFFRLNRNNYLELRLMQVQEFINKEYSITERFVASAQNTNSTDSHRQRLHIYLEHLNLAIANLEATVARLKSIN